MLQLLQEKNFFPFFCSPPCTLQKAGGSVNGKSRFAGCKTAFGGGEWVFIGLIAGLVAAYLKRVGSVASAGRSSYSLWLCFGSNEVGYPNSIFRQE